MFAARHGDGLVRLVMLCYVMVMIGIWCECECVRFLDVVGVEPARCCVVFGDVSFEVGH